MNQEQIRIQLRSAPGEPTGNDPKFQEELGEFCNGLRATGVHFSQYGIAFDSIDSHGYALADFAVKALGPPAIGAFTAICVAWVHARSGRKLRVKIGNVEAEGQTTCEIENLLKQASNFQERTSSKNEME